MTVTSRRKRLGYHALVYDNNFNLVAFYDDFFSIYYKKMLNAPGMATAIVPDDHAILNYLADDMLIKIALVTDYQYPLGGIIDFQGLYRDHQVATDEYGKKHYVLQFPGTTEILSRAIVGYKAGISGYSTWSSVAADTIMRNIIGYNFYGPQIAGTRVRSRSGELAGGYYSYNDATGSSTPAGVAPALTYSAAYRNALEALQELAKLGDVDFEVLHDYVHYDYNLGTDVYNALGMAAFTYPGLKGQDRSSSLYFDLALNNISQANLNGDRLREKTVTIVGGPGEGSARTIATRTGTNYDATHNDYELFVDARGNASSELNSIGDAKLLENQAKTRVEATVAQSNGYQYPRDYNLGDRVSVRFGGTVVTKRITAIEVSFTEQYDNARIQVEFEDA